MRAAVSYGQCECIYSARFGLQMYLHARDTLVDYEELYTANARIPRVVFKIMQYINVLYVALCKSFWDVQMSQHVVVEIT